MQVDNCLHSIEYVIFVAGLTTLFILSHVISNY